jgi:hypothetical protein
MKLCLAICAALAAYASGFAPAPNQQQVRAKSQDLNPYKTDFFLSASRQQSDVSPPGAPVLIPIFDNHQLPDTALYGVGRRAAFGQVVASAAAAAAVLPDLASADGAVSAATRARAKFVHGSKIAALKAAVDKGDLDAVAAAKNAFVLFNSGVYPTPKEKDLRKAAVENTNAIFAAVRSGDKSALKTAYGKYVASNGIKAPPAVDWKKGQGFSGEYDYKIRTPSGYVSTFLFPDRFPVRSPVSHILFQLLGFVTLFLSVTNSAVYRH